MSDKVESSPGPQGLPPEKLEIIRELNTAFSGDRELIKNYLQKFGFSKVVAPNIRIIRREAQERNELFEKVKNGSISVAARPAAEERAAKRPAKKEEGDHAERSPYYQSDVSCAFCDTHFSAAIFRSKSLILDFLYKDPQYPLMVPSAKGTVKGYKLEDPLLRNIIVCPGCLYASSIMGNFVHDAGAGPKTMKSRVPDRKFAALKEAMMNGVEDRRKAISAEFAAADAWGETRGVEQAIASFLLAAQSARVMAEFDALGHYQAGEALLCAARLYSELDRSDEEFDMFRQVIPIFEKFYQIGSVSATPLYLISVLSYHLGDYDTTRTWLGRMISMRHKLEGFSKYKRYGENLKDKIKDHGEG